MTPCRGALDSGSGVPAEDGELRVWAPVHTGKDGAVGSLPSSGKPPAPLTPGLDSRPRFLCFPASARLGVLDCHQDSRLPGWARLPTICPPGGAGGP